MPAFNKMFTADHNSFDADAALRDRKVVLVRGSENTLGEHGLPIFMQYVVSQVFLAALRRFRIPKVKRHQCYLICDESSHIYNPQSKRILVEARKLGLSFISATQLIDQIPPDVKAAIYGATAFKFVGNVGHDDAQQLARELRCDAAQIMSMKSRPPKDADWMVFVADEMNHGIKITVPMLALEKMPKQKAAPIVRAPLSPAITSDKRSEPLKRPLTDEQREAGIQRTLKILDERNSDDDPTKPVRE
jgi:hypothetical protein